MFGMTPCTTRLWEQVSGGFAAAHLLPRVLAQVAVMSTEGRHLLFIYSPRKSVMERAKNNT